MADSLAIGQPSCKAAAGERSRYPAVMCDDGGSAGHAGGGGEAGGVECGVAAGVARRRGVPEAAYSAGRDRGCSRRTG